MKRHWNYRVIEFTHGDESWRVIHEVHYENDVPVMYSETPAAVHWDTEEEAQAPFDILERMKQALEKEVLLVDDFNQGGE